MPKKQEILKLIPELRKRYFALRSGKESLITMINETEVAEHVYNSNAIENSTLTLEETEKILLEIDLDRFISQREMFEAKNLARVVSYIEKKAVEAELDLGQILLLHKMLISNIRDEIAGRFRKEKEWVKVANHIAPDPASVIMLLQQALDTYQANVDQHIMERIALFHLQFEHIHPFVDGNGRIGRVLNNYLLIREGYVPINIKYKNRSKYYEALIEFDKTKQTKGMQEIIGKSLTNSYYKRLAYLESKKIISLNEYSKTKKLPLNNLLNKAERQTIEAFSEKGIWKIGV